MLKKVLYLVKTAGVLAITSSFMDQILQARLTELKAHALIQVAQAHVE